MDVGGDEPVVGDLEAVVATDLDVLADPGDGGDAVGLEIDRRIGGDLGGELVAELLEGVVAGDEVGLAVDLDEDADLAAVDDGLGDEAVLGLAAGLLGGAGLALLAKDVDGAVEVAAGFDERVLAVHEAGAGHLTELAHEGWGDVCHDRKKLVLWVRWCPAFTGRPSQGA